MLKPYPKWRSRFIIAALLLSGSYEAACQANESWREELDQLASKYGIEVVTTEPRFPVQTKYGNFDGKAASDNELEEYLRIFVPEFSLYPAEFVRCAKITRIVFCKDLSVDGQLRGAIPDYYHDHALYYDVCRGMYNTEYMRKVIHHEFFHIIDKRDDGRLYKDDRWASLNKEDFEYGEGGKHAQEIADTGTLTTKYPGFLNHYSTTGVEEDKAEMFALMIIDPAYVEKHGRRDPVLNSKAERMRELLVRFCPEMGEEFWAQVKQRNSSSTETAGACATTVSQLRSVERNRHNRTLSRLQYSDRPLEPRRATRKVVRCRI